MNYKAIMIEIIACKIIKLNKEEKWEKKFGGKW